MKRKEEEWWGVDQEDVGGGRAMESGAGRHWRQEFVRMIVRLFCFIFCRGSFIIIIYRVRVIVGIIEIKWAGGDQEEEEKECKFEIMEVMEGGG